MLDHAERCRIDTGDAMAPSVVREAMDAGIFVGMPTTMLLVGLLVSYLPARRASTVDSIESLREE